MCLMALEAQVPPAGALLTGLGQGATTGPVPRKANSTSILGLGRIITDICWGLVSLGLALPIGLAPLAVAMLALAFALLEVCHLVFRIFPNVVSTC